MKVLVALDRTPKDAALIPVAARFATQCGAEVVLMHVVDPLVDWADKPTRTFDENREQLARERQAYLDEYAKAIPNGKASTRLEWTQKTEEIDERVARVAAELQADLLVVASRRAGSLKGFILGSRARSLLQTSPCPVVVVRPEQE